MFIRMFSCTFEDMSNDMSVEGHTYLRRQSLSKGLGFGLRKHGGFSCTLRLLLSFTGTSKCNDDMLARAIGVVIQVRTKIVSIVGTPARK